MFYTYIVRCKDGSLYTGFTVDPVRRIQTHNDGKGAKYTRNRLPVCLVHLEQFETEREARSRECAIKRMTRAAKLRLISREQT